MQFEHMGSIGPHNNNNNNNNNLLLTKICCKNIFTIFPQQIIRGKLLLILI